MRRTLALLVGVYASVPVLLYLSPWLLAHAVFAHLLRVPFFVDLSRPQDVLNHTCSFHLNTEEDVWVGVWHTLPASQWEAASGRGADWFQEALGDGRPVIIYLHGNVGTRALKHRVDLVKVLSAAGFHVLSLDYRGFGDSSGDPSEAGLTSDALYLQQWARARSGGGPVILWGHSLGSGVATNAAVRLQDAGSAVDALVLEAPYTRIRDVAANLLITKIYTFLPGLKNFLFDLLKKNQIEFANDENLKTLTCPLLLLHAEDDAVVPHHMGLQLQQISVEARRGLGEHAPVTMVSYRAELGFSHSSIHLDPSLPATVQKFVQNLRGTTT
ncbi:hypothetical protein OJAV_G00217910 [Oryzias javanicus]|uniref:AB hydrolase-1 domain-containing protein n=1 Tax=Oryzias javanicus TaxID=123683 RepID=A0A3S2MEH5_ORYJA|nr:hypothetical protein OJAV_G00217910 [Oryzias javanicus]